MFILATLQWIVNNKKALLSTFPEGSTVVCIGDGLAMVVISEAIRDYGSLSGEDGGGGPSWKKPG